MTSTYRRVFVYIALIALVVFVAIAFYMSVKSRLYQELNPAPTVYHAARPVAGGLWEAGRQA